MEHHTVRLYAQRFLPNVGLLSGFFAFQLNHRAEYDIRRGDRDNIPALDLRLSTQTAEVRLAHEDFLGLRGNVAVHWNYRKNSNIPGTGVRPLIPNYNSYTPAVSLVEKWLGHKIEIEAGLRYEFEHLVVKRFDNSNDLIVSEFNFNNFSTSAGMNWDVSESITLNANLGTTNRSPDVNELFSEGLHHGAAAIEEGDSTLQPEKAIKLIAGVELRKKRIQGRASVYWQTIDDFIYLRPDSEPRLTIRGAFPVFRYVQTDARLWGLDAAINLELTWNVWLESKYSMVRAENREEDQPLIFMPADRMSHGLKWESPNSGFHAGLSWDYVWGADACSGRTRLRTAAGRLFTVSPEWRNYNDAWATDP